MNFIIMLILFVLFLFPFSGIQNAIVFGETNDDVDKDLRGMLFFNHTKYSRSYIISFGNFIIPFGTIY